MNISYESTNQTNDQNPNKEENDYLKKYNSLNDFRNNIEKAIIYDESRQSMVNLYHGTNNEKWFLEELIKNFDQLVTYESGVLFISDINSRINDNFPAWTEAIFLHYLEILKFNCGVKLLRQTIRSKKNSNQATLLIEDVFNNFEEQKKNENYFDFFTEILKIYKGDETVKEILNSFDWTADETTFKYLSCFCKNFSISEIQFLLPYIENPLKFIDNENDVNILNLTLFYSDDKIAEELNNKLIPRLPIFFSYDFLTKLILTMINRATKEQLFSVYTAFDITLRKKNFKYSTNFDLAVLIALESMDWEKRFDFLSAHYAYFKNTESKKIINLLKAMELNEKNYKK